MEANTPMSKVRSVQVTKADGKRLEEEARKMEAKLNMLRGLMEDGGEGPKASGNGRWSSGGLQKPLRRNYVSEVIKNPAPAPGREKQRPAMDFQPPAPRPPAGSGRAGPSAGAAGGGGSAQPPGSAPRQQAQQQLSGTS